MNERMKFDPAPAEQAGQIDAMKIFAAVLNKEYANHSDELLEGCMSEIVGLALENRIEESQVRLRGFCNFLAVQIAHAVAMGHL
jgi:hypothetical protein